MSKHRTPTLALAGLLLAAVAGPLPAETGLETLLGNQGEIYRAQAGTYGELFDDPDAPDAGDGLLVLDVELPDGSRSRQIVPGSEGPEAETLHVASYEKSSGTLDLLWETTGDDGLSSIFLASFDGVEWAEPQVITADVEALAATRLTITHDNYDLQLSDDQTLAASRRVIHLTQLTGAPESPEILYTPVVLIEGAYIGWSETFSLNELALSSPFVDDPGDELPEALLSALSLQTSSNGRRVLATFANALDGKICSLEIGVLPVELVYLGDEIRDQVLALGDTVDASDVAALADAARNQIIGVGQRLSFDPSVVDYVADSAQGWILDAGDTYASGDLDALADDLRDYTLDLMSSLFSPAVSTADGASGTIIEIDIGDLLGDGPSASQILDLRMPFERSLPEIGEGSTRILASRDGKEVMVTWHDAGAEELHFVESLDDGWREAQTLELDDELSLEAAYALLERRLD